MTSRTVKVALSAYVDAEGRHLYGWRGETVDVHPDHVAQFDEFNVGSLGSEPEPVEDDEPDDDGKPRGNASLEVWQEYARANGVDPGDLKRDELRELFD